MTDRFAHPRQWGAELVGAGARFRLWAPAMERVRLRLSGREHATSRDAEGWFTAEIEGAKPGDDYAFVLDDGFAVPDPAARAQAGDVHGASRLIDPLAYAWKTVGWRGRPWEETVFYELHTGTFSGEGTFDGVRARLDHLARTGVTAIELMPVAQFAGERGWGYDGVLLYAPHPVYGGPEGLKRLVDAAHERGLMMFLDVVYNHFGAEGNYLGRYAPDFFHPEISTPWGGAIAFDKRAVRDFFIDNALYWLEEYRFDGLRLDAVDHIDHESDEPILEEIAETVRSRITDRHVHLTTEDDRNITRLHERGPDGEIRLYSGEWNDDIHHAMHVAATREGEGYYRDFGVHHAELLAKGLAEGFVFQGQPSVHRSGRTRGQPSAHLPPTAFVNFMQNHDQIGNRAFGERLTDLADPEIVEALSAILLLSPPIPLLFMGEEWGETNTFSFFCDLDGWLADAVREGRRREFRAWSAFRDAEARTRIPDPNDPATFTSSRLDWRELDRPERQARLGYMRTLLDLRQREIVPRLKGIGGHAGAWRLVAPETIEVGWTMGDRSRLTLLSNLDREPRPVDRPPDGRLLFESVPDAFDRVGQGTIPGRTTLFTLEAPRLLGDVKP